ncbi:response regulator [uncultured Nitrospira sp.]|uniref:response regulator n=1 Tax=uncultured Nitrospira sp. TaxID=157176 RepID=UPI003140C193
MTSSSPQTLEKISGIDSVTVLLIDDSPDNLMILGDILERIGYQVVCAEDGESGLERAKCVQPDLIFMDVKMPGLDGFQVCERLRAQKNFQHTPIILMSAQSDSTNLELALGAGASEFWPKPISPGKILNELPGFFARRSRVPRLLHQNYGNQNQHSPTFSTPSL